MEERNQTNSKRNVRIEMHQLLWKRVFAHCAVLRKRRCKSAYFVSSESWKQRRCGVCLVWRRRSEDDMCTISISSEMCAIYTYLILWYFSIFVSHLAEPINSDETRPTVNYTYIQISWPIRATTTAIGVIVVDNDIIIFIGDFRHSLWIVFSIRRVPEFPITNVIFKFFFPDFHYWIHMLGI